MRLIPLSAGRAYSKVDDKSRGQWTAQIKKDQQVTHLGRFNSEEDAARAYDESAKVVHGEFACLNFPS